MSAIILYLAGNLVRASIMRRPANPIKLNSGTFSHENFYFGDWVPLRDLTGQIVGFKIVPFAKHEYLKSRILTAKFVTEGKNVSIERAGKDTYIYILLKTSQRFEEDVAQFIEAAVFHNQNDDFIVRLDGFRRNDWNLLGFEFTEIVTEIKLCE
jgi:hypothetical protein